MIPDSNENAVKFSQRMSLVGADLLLESLLKLDDALKTDEEAIISRLRINFLKSS